MQAHYHQPFLQGTQQPRLPVAVDFGDQDVPDVDEQMLLEDIENDEELEEVEEGDGHDGFALKDNEGAADVAAVDSTSAPSAAEFSYPNEMPIQYPPMLPPPTFLMPYFFTPPQHNPYSLSGGRGHLHPPVISQNPYPIHLAVPSLSTPSHVIPPTSSTPEDPDAPSQTPDNAEVRLEGLRAWRH